MITRIGRSLAIDGAYIHSYAAVVGKKEGEGPIGNEFDKICDDTTLGQSSWEKAESTLLKQAIDLCVSKSNVPVKDYDMIFCGDLLDQCMGSTMAVRSMGIPTIGLYGACSTMAEGLVLAGLCAGAGVTNHALVTAESHFCSAERQFRFPLGYGGQRTPTSQWTVTGAGVAAVSPTASAICIKDVTPGRIVDMGVTDANNMGAAMAPAALDTLVSFFTDTATAPDDYDLIITGDLGQVGSEILRDLMQREGKPLGANYTDCGLMIYDRDRQDVHAGGSGCGCAASVLCGYLLPRIENGTLNNVLFMATGALMSPTSSQQGMSIPSIAHLVHLTHA